MLGGAISAVGVEVAKTDAPAEQADDSASSQATQEPAAEESSEQSADETEKSATLTCADKKTCEVVFKPPSDETVKPFGLKVKLAGAQGKKIAISVDGKKYSIGSGKSVKVKGATVKLVASTDSAYTLEFRKS